MATANGARTLADAYPGRFLLGIGVSHAPSVASARPRVREAARDDERAISTRWTRPLFRGVEPPDPAPRVLAALGPKMLQLAAERTRGAHPYFTPPEHTAMAREVMGAGPLLLPEQAFVLETDATAARATGREHMATTSRSTTTGATCSGSGSRTTSFEGGGSDRLVDAIVAWGDVDAVRDRVAAHLDAGADHVCVQAIGGDPLRELRQLAPALRDL